jgi:hypothetical protein
MTDLERRTGGRVFSPLKTTNEGRHASVARELKNQYIITTRKNDKRDRTLRRVGYFFLGRIRGFRTASYYAPQTRLEALNLGFPAKLKVNSKLLSSAALLVHPLNCLSLIWRGGLGGRVSRFWGHALASPFGGIPWWPWARRF